MNDEAVGRTAPATPGLLTSRVFLLLIKTVHLFIDYNIWPLLLMAFNIFTFYDGGSLAFSAPK